MAPSSTTAGAKRKAAQEPIAMVPTSSSADGNESDSGASSSSSTSSSDPSFINVDFDFLPPNPTLDEPAIRRLLRQLFYTHADDLDLFCLADYVVRAPRGVGTVLKVEGDEEQDPFAFIGALPLAGAAKAVGCEGEDERAAKIATEYLVNHLPEESPISTLLTSTNQEARPWLFLHERFVNLPPQVAPPLYRLATEELAASFADAEGSEKGKEPTHVLFLSRVFSSEAYSDDEDEPMDGSADKPGPMRVGEDDDDAPRGLRSKKGESASAAAAKKQRRSAPQQKGERLPLGHFRPEDPLLASYNPKETHTATFRFPPPRNAQEGFESPLFAHVVCLRWEDVKGGEVWERVAEKLVGEAGARVE